VLVLYSLVVNSYSIYWVLLVVCSVLGLLVSKIFYGLLLLDIIDHSVVLKNVIKSITLNYKQLVMTTVLGLMVLYLYSLIAYQSPEFRDSMQDGNETSICETQFQCLIFIIH
jgi:inositol 1,4,5-triphosphate receptor type 3